jgi:hypothetical protein
LARNLVKPRIVQRKEFVALLDWKVTSEQGMPLSPTAAVLLTPTIFAYFLPYFISKSFVSVGLSTGSAFGIRTRSAQNADVNFLEVVCVRVRPCISIARALHCSCNAGNCLLSAFLFLRSSCCLT